MDRNWVAHSGFQSTLISWLPPSALLPPPPLWVYDDGDMILWRDNSFRLKTRCAGTVHEASYMGGEPSVNAVKVENVTTTREEVWSSSSSSNLVRHTPH
ncbi:hypothetical protein BHE74_00019327 [Ensete ventricosum]|nr:hypothetical protein GW17_00046619 [Ensete ventricosum]RWW72835.1 hypothetical protein BHE74_00019327 [Ensete ventricosum]RZR93581.1 hypothetical protein BHM03_00022142 [Ensete ventricosum]